MWDPERDKYTEYDDFHIYDQEYTRSRLARISWISAVVIILIGVVVYLCK